MASGHETLTSAKTLFKQPNFREIHVTPSDTARRLWSWAAQMEAGDLVRFDCEDRAAAKRLQRWFFRERKRSKVQMIATAPLSDHDEMDVMRGIVTWLEGATIVLSVPKPFSKITMTKADGSVVDLTAVDPDAAKLTEAILKKPPRVRGRSGRQK